MDNLGAIAGPILALGLVTAFGVRTAILVSVVPGLLAVAAIVYAVRHLPGEATREREPIRFAVRRVLQGRLGRLLVAVGLFELGNIAATLLILRATELLIPERGVESATLIGLLLYLAYNSAAAAVSFPAGQLSDRIGPVRVLGLGVGAFLLAYVGFAIATASVISLLVPFVLAGVGIGAVETAEHAAVASAAPENRRGSAFGVLAATQSFGNLAASAGAGLLWTALSPNAAFMTIAALMVASLLALARVRAAAE